MTDNVTQIHQPLTQDDWKFIFDVLEGTKLDVPRIRSEVVRLMLLTQEQARENERLQCNLKDALEPQSPTTADGPVALELSWVPLNKRDLNWHAHATTQLRSMHAALSAYEKTPRDPLEIEELWDEAHELLQQGGDHGPEVHELFARLIERAHGIGAEQR